MMELMFRSKNIADISFPLPFHEYFRQICEIENELTKLKFNDQLNAGHNLFVCDGNLPLRNTCFILRPDFRDDLSYIFILLLFTFGLSC